jgi:transposase InsO family protein
VGARARLVHCEQRPLRQPADSPDLRDDHQQRVSRKRVIRLMQQNGLQGHVRKRFKCTTTSDHDQPVAANLLDRQFNAAAPNQRWVGTRPSS